MTAQSQRGARYVLYEAEESVRRLHRENPACVMVIQQLADSRQPQEDFGRLEASLRKDYFGAHIDAFTRICDRIERALDDPTEPYEEKKLLLLARLRIKRQLAHHQNKLAELE